MSLVATCHLSTPLLCCRVLPGPRGLPLCAVAFSSESSALPLCSCCDLSNLNVAVLDVVPAVPEAVLIFLDSGLFFLSSLGGSATQPSRSLVCSSII